MAAIYDTITLMNKLYFCISRINSLQKYGINSLLISKYCENLDLQTRFKTKSILEYYGLRVLVFLSLKGRMSMFCWR